jgi:hypothetical protein
MASLAPQADDLVLRLSSLEKAGALHGDLRIPLEAVESVVADQRPFRALRGIRAPGTGFPGLIALGTWRYRGGKDFAALYRGRSAVVVTLRDASFRRLLVSADDADAVTSRVRSALA